MAYKFQYGDAVYSGSLNIETNLTGSKVSLGTANSAASVARGTLDLSDADGASYGIKLGGTLVTADASELNKLDGVTATTAELNYVDTTAGTAAASKAVILDADKSITGISNLTASFFSGNGSGLSNVSTSPAGSDTQVQFNQNGSSAGDSGLVYDGSGSLDLVEFSAGSIGLKLAGTLVTSTAAELNLLDTAAAGSVVNSKAVIYDGGGHVNATQLSSSFGITGSALTLGGTAVGSSASDLNLPQGMAQSTGTALASAFVALDADKSVTGISNLTASFFSGDGSGLSNITADANGSDTQVQFNQNGEFAGDSGLLYNGSGSLDLAEADGSGIGLKLAGTLVTATAAELNYVDIASLGTAAASKALVADASANLDASAITFTDLGTVTTVDINGGTIDGTTIGVASAAVVTASYLAVNGNVDLGNGSDVINLGSGGSDSVYFNGFASFQAGAAYNLQSITSNDTLAAGDFYNIVSGSDDVTVTLPNVNNIDNGTMFHVKRAYGMEHDVTIASGSGTNSIDGEALVVLESALAAVSLLWDSNAGVWHIF